MVERIACVVLTLVAGAVLAESPGVEEALPAAPGASSPNYALGWSVLEANGGGAATSPSYRATVTIGQSIVGRTSNAASAAELGFWYGAVPELFSDGFESGDTSNWSSTVGGG